MRARALFALWALCPAASAQSSSGGGYTLDGAGFVSAGAAPLAGSAYRVQGLAGLDLLPPPLFGPDLLRGGDYELRRGPFNPPRFSFQNARDNVAADFSGALTLTLPTLSIGLPSFDVVFRQDPANDPLAVDPEKIRRANAVMRANKGELAQASPSHVWELHFMDESGLHDGSLGSAGRISFRFLDANGDGLVDGTNPPVRAKTMSLWSLDEAQGVWVKVPGAAVDVAGRQVSAPLGHLSVYALIGGADASVDEVYAYPVPFRPRGPEAGSGAGQTGTESGGITFTNLPGEGRIEIYTLDGRRVRALDIPANLNPAKLGWDARNESGQPVAGGVYIWRIVSGANSKTGRLMVIR